MKYLKICFCRHCKALDYAGEQCPKCGSRDIVDASLDFLSFGNIKNRLYSEAAVQAAGHICCIDRIKE